MNDNEQASIAGYKQGSQELLKWDNEKGTTWATCIRLNRSDALPFYEDLEAFFKKHGITYLVEGQNKNWTSIVSDDRGNEDDPECWPNEALAKAGALNAAFDRLEWLLSFNSTSPSPE